MWRPVLATIVLAALALSLGYYLSNAPLGEISADGAAGSAPSMAGTSSKPALEIPAATSTSDPSTDAKTAIAIVHTAEPLPPADTPLNKIYAELKARAAAGDADAASRLYRDLRRCSHARKSVWRDVNIAQRVLRRSASGLSPEQLSRYQAQLDQVQDQLEASRRVQSMCTGVTERMLDNLTPAMLRAAKLGDASARDCYVHRGPMVDPRSLIENPAAIIRYKEEAPGLIDSALAAGDWKMVAMLQYAYGPRGKNLISGLVGADPMQHYRYLKLFRLGADANRARGLDVSLAIAAMRLTPEQLTTANRWAEQAFRSDFSGSSTAATPYRWDACALPVE